MGTINAKENAHNLEQQMLAVCHSQGTVCLFHSSESICSKIPATTIHTCHPLKTFGGPETKLNFMSSKNGKV